MSSYRKHSLEKPVPVDYLPNVTCDHLPYEIVQRSGVLAKKAARDYQLRQRPGFHQLIVCTEGEGTHIVDFEPVPLQRGSVLRIHLGQVQQFLPNQRFEATMVVWPLDSHLSSSTRPTWFPGSKIPTRWELAEPDLDRLLGWLDDLHAEQAAFDGSSVKREVLVAMLHTFLLRVESTLPANQTSSSQLPQPYIDLRMEIEARLYARPTVEFLASSIGYSSRTLDRACHFAVGKTAKQVLDERTALEVRRLLTQTDRSVASIGRDFGFDDASNFSKFVKRHLGALPSVLRQQGHI